MTMRQIKRAVRLAPPEICALYDEYKLLAQTPEEKQRHRDIARQLEAYCLKHKTRFLYTQDLDIRMTYAPVAGGGSRPCFLSRQAKWPRLELLKRKPVPADAPPIARLIDEMAAMYEDESASLEQWTQAKNRLLVYAGELGRRILRSGQHKAIISQCLQPDGSTDPIVVIKKRDDRT